MSGGGVENRSPEGQGMSQCDTEPGGEVGRHRARRHRRCRRANVCVCACTCASVCYNCVCLCNASVTGACVVCGTSFSVPLQCPGCGARSTPSAHPRSSIPFPPSTALSHSRSHAPPGGAARAALAFDNHPFNIFLTCFFPGHQKLFSYVASFVSPLAYFFRHVYSPPQGSCILCSNISPNSCDQNGAFKYPKRFCVQIRFFLTAKLKKSPQC